MKTKPTSSDMLLKSTMPDQVSHSFADKGPKLVNSGLPTTNVVQTTDFSADQDQALLNNREIDVQDVDEAISPDNPDKKSNIRHKRARRAQGR